MILAAVVLTTAAQARHLNWSQTHVPVMVVDLLLWVGLVRLMLRSGSWWPIWMAAAQTLTLATHLATTLITQFNQEAYVSLSTVWAIPCLLSLIVGVTLDLRRSEGR